MNLVYIASAYRGDVENNILKAIEYCRYTATCGFIPICPHIYFTQFLNDDIEVERIKGISMGLQLLSMCSEIWVFGENITEGMKKEIAEAERLGIPISYREWSENQCISTQTI